MKCMAHFHDKFLIKGNYRLSKIKNGRMKYWLTYPNEVLDPKFYRWRNKIKHEGGWELRELGIKSTHNIIFQPNPKT